MNPHDARLMSRYLDHAISMIKQAEAYMPRQYQQQALEITLKIMELEKTIRKES
ncbi:hypothetical protein PP749_gp094 [Rhizobium phage RHEph22]|uniref:Uncharacterized protein n=1 Tax=Rhizobium phage RHEph22 TaxID=2836135 RepID=A0AAE7VN49_9CAUD|nr:hypothetical protein PP749_gp094 [Rhizobium phage RHEph22]QXV74771.1 hypothetical protein [Rhizobium phage RHEph22]QXV74867.1 hypothetical protein [Rhizobium phage RHEph24]